MMHPRPTSSGKNDGKKADKQRISRLFGRNRIARNPYKTRWPDLFQEDIFVVLMGPTGVGKSSFIEIATGIQGIVGHGLESQTTEISTFKLPFPAFGSSEVFLVDTPGFDDTKESDVATVRMISNWLCNTYKRRHRIVGLLYFHRISDNRMGQSALQNLLLFHGLCGEHFDGRIICTTTMWDEVDEDIGASREEELKSDYWNDSGSSVQRFRRNRESAFEILAPIFEDVHNDRFLFLRNEIGVLGVKLKHTAVGLALLTKLEASVSLLQEILVEFRTQSTQSPIDPEQLQLLTNRFQDVSMQLQHMMRSAIRKTMPPRPRRVIKPARWTQCFGSKRAQRTQPSQETVARTPESQDNQVTTPASSQGEIHGNLLLEESRTASPTQDARAPSPTPSEDNLPILQPIEREQSRHEHQRHFQSTGRVPGPQRSKGMQGWGLQLKRLHTPLLDQTDSPGQGSSGLPPSEDDQRIKELRRMPGPRRSKSSQAWGRLMKRLPTPQLDETTFFREAGSQSDSRYGALEQLNPEPRLVPGPCRSKGIEGWGIRFRRMQNSQPDQTTPASHPLPMHSQLANTQPSEGQAGSSQPSQLMRTRSLPPIRCHEDTGLRPIHDTQEWLGNAPPSLTQHTATLPVNLKRPSPRHSSECSDYAQRPSLENAPLPARMSPKEEFIIMQPR